MDRKRQRELVLGAVVIILAAVAAWSLRSGTPQPSSSATANRPANAQVRPKSPLVEVDLKALEAERPEPQGSTRNPFRFKPKPAPPLPPTAAQIKQQQQAAVEMAARGPVDAPPPRIPLKYIGDMSDPNNPSKRIAILSDARSTYYGREGEIVEGRYRIMRIGVESIELAYLDGRGRQTIRQTGQ
ncbi:MAG TPA: hypothetical protein VFO48_04770 [Vicinamibacterales bacterium]|nr:hypothetical protein [Vicinamibacterales bacterium]